MDSGLKMAHHGAHKGSGLPPKEPKPSKVCNGLPPKDATSPNPKKILHREDRKDGKPWEYRQCSPGGNSVFHVPLPAPPPSCSDCKQGLAGVGKFAEQLQEACRAGTRTSDRLSAVLSGTPLGEVAGQFLAVQRRLESGIGDVVTWIKTEVDAYLKRLNCEEGGKGGDGVKGQGHSQDDLQVLSMGLHLMVQLQQQFFLNAADQLNTFAQSHAVSGTSSTAPNPRASRPNGGGGQPGVEAKAGDQSEGRNPMSGHGIGSASRVSEQLAALLSGHRLAAGKDNTGCPQSKSSWYVTMDKEVGSSSTRGSPPAAAAGRERQVVPSAGQMPGNHGHHRRNQSNPGLHETAAFSREGDHCTRPVKGASVQKGGPANGLPNNPGEPVSQEELDVVINMLSRATKYASPDTKEGGSSVVDPSNPSPSLDLKSKAPGSQLAGGNPHPVFMTNPVSAAGSARDQPGNYGNRATQHRQSDGFICNTTPSREAKTNTWPFKPRHKDPSMGWLDGEYPQAGPMFFPNGAYDPLTQQGAMFGVPPPGSGTRQNALIPGLHPSLWSTAPDECTSKGWPAFPNIGDGETIPRQWTNMADSSSCSDESSSNGELQWMMGAPLLEAVNMKRRHSSGGEDTAVTSGVGLSYNINKSIDSLMEPKSTNTWPPKHPWVSKQNIDPNLGSDPPEVASMTGVTKSAHRPLMPQWSDPLATRPLAIWDGALTSSVSQQGFSTLTPGVPPVEYSPSSSKQF